MFQDRGHIALVDGTMIKNGKVIGTYDGTYVTPCDEPYEDYEPAIASIVEELWFSQEKAVEEEVESEPEDISKPETAKFDFSELTKEVDSFFERLKKEG